MQETWTYGYDQRNQLISVEKRVTDGGTLQLKDEFKYDAFGSRIEKKIDADGNSVSAPRICTTRSAGTRRSRTR